MSNQLYSGQGRDINVFAGQSLAVSSITGAYTATIIAGAGIGTALATDSAGGATYGPYSGGVTVRLKAGEGALLDYEAAVNPVLNYAGPARLGYSAAGDTSSVVSEAGILTDLNRTALASGGAKNRVIKKFTDAIGVTVANSGTAATHSIATGPWGGPAYKIEMGAGNTYTEVQLSGRNIAAFGGHVAWRVWVEDYTKFGQIAAYAGTSGYSRSYVNNHSLNGSNTNRFNGEHIVVCGPTRAAQTNTFVAGTDTLNDIKLRITTAGASGGVAWIDAAMVPGIGRPTHVITHDDASVTWMANALPVLAANRLRATFGIYTSVLGTSPTLYLSNAQVAEIAAAGHQVSSHNINNYPLDNGVIVDANKQTAAAYTADFVAASATLSGLAGERFDASYHPLVQGSHSQAAFDTMRAAGMILARGTDNGAAYNFPQCGLGHGVLAMKTQALNTMTQAQILTAVEATKTYGLTTFWMVHEITEAGGVGVETSRANYEYLVNLIGADVAAGRAVHKTAGELAREVYAERLVPADLLA